MWQLRCGKRLPYRGVIVAARGTRLLDVYVEENLIPGRRGVLKPSPPGNASRRSGQLLRALGLSALLLGAFGVLTVLVAGPLRPLDVALNFERDLEGWRTALTTVDRIGQRAVCVPILLLVAFVASRRAATWRPVVVALLSVVVVNFCVAAFKFTLDRGAPLDGEPGFLEGGVMYPSGHATNVVLVYGLAAYLWSHYTGASRRTRHVLVATVVALTVVMVMTSLTLRWHWFTDLLAGVLVGAAVLRAATAFDRHFPAGSAWFTRPFRTTRAAAGRDSDVAEGLDLGPQVVEPFSQVLVPAVDDVDAAQDRGALGGEHRQQDDDSGAQSRGTHDLRAAPPGGSLDHDSVRVE